MNDETPPPLLTKSEDPFEAAAVMFGLYEPKYEKLIGKLASGEARRLAKALVAYPLIDKPFINDSQDLRNAYAMGRALIEAQIMMTIKSLYDHEQLLQNQAVVDKAREEAKEMTNETTS